jgi:hypothetical protein
MSRVAEQAVFLLDVCKLVQFATERGFVVTGGELYRTTEQQQIYVKTGRSKTMASRHLGRLAMDLNFFKDGALTYDTSEIGRYWEALSPKNSAGMFWKSFKDAPHFERRA